MDNPEVFSKKHTQRLLKKTKTLGKKKLWRAHTHTHTHTHTHAQSSQPTLWFCSSSLKCVLGIWYLFLGWWHRMLMEGHFWWKSQKKLLCDSAEIIIDGLWNSSAGKPLICRACSLSVLYCEQLKGSTKYSLDESALVPMTPTDKSPFRENAFH